MPGPSDFTPTTRMALAALSGGTCYFPGCQRRVIAYDDGEPYVNVDIAHIRDAKPGNRYDPAMSDDERRAFANLILLCKIHHDRVDKRHPEQFSVDELLSWKREREKENGALLEASGIDDSTLEEALRAASIDVAVSGVLSLGGTGGAGLSSGGGGGGVIGSGTGGDGGPGGSITINDSTRVDVDGTGADGVGSGGGGAGGVLPGAFATPDHRIGLEGKGFSDGVDGAPGGDSYIADENGNVLVLAKGGATAERGTSDRLSISCLVAANYAELRDGLAFVAGGAWQSYSLLNVPDTLHFVLVVVLEAGGVPNGEYTMFIEARGPTDEAKAMVAFPIVVEQTGDVLRIARVVRLSVPVDAFGFGDSLQNMRTATWPLSQS